MGWLFFYGGVWGRFFWEDVVLIMWFVLLFLELGVLWLFFIYRCFACGVVRYGVCLGWILGWEGGGLCLVFSGY